MSCEEHSYSLGKSELNFPERKPTFRVCHGRRLCYVFEELTLPLPRSTHPNAIG